MHNSIKTLTNAITTDDRLGELLSSKPGTPADIGAAYVTGMMLTGFGYVNGSGPRFDATAPRPDGTRYAARHIANHITDSDGTIRQAILKEADNTIREPTLKDIVQYAPGCVKSRGGTLTKGVALLAYIGANLRSQAKARKRWFGDAASGPAQEIADELMGHELVKPFQPGIEGIIYNNHELPSQALRKPTAEEQNAAFVAQQQKVRAKRAAAYASPR